MPAVLDDPPAQTTAPAERLRTATAATRVSVRWLGVRKTLTPEQKSRAADAFGAESQYVSAGKKLLDTKHPAIQAVTSVRNRAVSYWKGMTLPFPEPGIRLIRQDRVEEFDGRMWEFSQDLDEAVNKLDEHFDELKCAARQRLGSLYNPADYPDSLTGMFAIEHEFLSVEPPDYLQQLNPRLYQQECDRIRQRFDEAVQLAEDAFASELQKLLAHLVERLSGEADGKPKVFRDSAVSNLTEFFERFRQLNIRSSADLDALVDQTQQVIRGVEPQSLRESQPLRSSGAGELSRVRDLLDDFLVERPRRNILRRPK